MTFEKYMQGTTQKKMAELLGVTQPLVNQWVNKKCRISARMAARIEERTNGQVTRKEMRPDLFY
jgi:DNA-binding transcriptional regulator YdaS (Cro superfamily)